jgi:lipid II:glycine glycyltransferase (peptidoglycan interpeptide bridge formation enzyme)
MAEEKAAAGPVHYMQTAAWAGVKAGYGWPSDELLSGLVSGGVLRVYKRSIPGVGKLFYCPGVAGVTSELASEFTEFIQKQYKGRGFGVRLELNQVRDEELLTSLKQAGWRTAKSHVQYRDTVVVDLGLNENDIWMSLKSRGRYEVLQAQKFGVESAEVEPTDKNLSKMYDLLQTTSTRNKFYIRDKKFTMDYWRKFADQNMLKLFFATHEGDLLAGATVIINKDLAWYKEGGSVREKSHMMAARALQWEVMKALKKAGVKTYDFGGIPSPSSHQTSSMHGIYVFKTAFSKQTIELMPTLELPLSMRYKLWPKAEKQWLRVYNLFAHNLWW